MVYYGGLEYFISRELDTISSSGNKAIPGKITTFVFLTSNSLKLQEF